MSRTTRDYWDASYQQTRRARRATVNPVRSYFAAAFLDFVRPHLPVASPDRPVRMIEMGCGGSRWLPYFAVHHGYEVAGVDYSADGCRLAEENLRAVGSGGRICCADFGRLEQLALGAFDVVLSMGVVEHFERTTEPIRWFMPCLAPGGLMITSVPNMSGRIGRLQRIVSRRTFDLHVPLDADRLASAHAASGLHVVAAGYFGFLLLGMVNFGRGPLGRLLGGGALVCDWLHGQWRRLSGSRRESAQWSSYTVVVARR